MEARRSSTDREERPAHAGRGASAVRSGAPIDQGRYGEALDLQHTAGNAATAALIAARGKGPVSDDEPLKGHSTVHRDDTGSGSGSGAKAPTRVSQDVKVTPIGTAKDLGRGGFDWKVWFSIGAPAGADGWVIQEIKADAKITKSGGAVVNENYHYWEAWQLKKDKKTTIYQDEGKDDNDDRYRTGPRPAGSSGTDVTLGKARFFEGALPADFKQNNPSTVAGILYSSTTQPDFWSGTMADHNLTSIWDDTVTPAKTDIKTTPT